MARQSVAASRDFGVAIGHRRSAARADLVGLEHEYVVHEADLQVDFRSIIHDLAIDGRRIDPGDSNAYRCAWGGVLTVDGAEAEVAVAPIGTRPGFGRQVREAADVARAALRSAVPARLGLNGYSTHISVSTPNGRTAHAARKFAETFAAAQMLLMDRHDSPGLLVRPRWGRLELGGEYVIGEPLRAAAVFAVGAARASAMRWHIGRRRHPPRLRTDVTRARQRDGWYVDRAAFGVDLLSEGRAASLQLSRRGTIVAQDQLEAAWEVARVALGRDVDQADVESVDRVVSGADPLPLEAGRDPPAPQGSTDLVTLELDIVRARVRPQFAVVAELATWRFTVFRVWNAERRAYASVPRELLPAFLARLEQGVLDAAISGYLRRLPSGRVLRDWHQAAAGAGLYDELGPRVAFATPEIDVFGRPLAMGGGGYGRAAKAGDRVGKREHERPGITPAPVGVPAPAPVPGLVPGGVPGRVPGPRVPVPARDRRIPIWPFVGAAIVGGLIFGAVVVGLPGGVPVATDRPTTAAFAIPPASAAAVVTPPPPVATTTPGVLATPTPAVVVTPTPGAVLTPAPTASPIVTPTPEPPPPEYFELLDHIGGELDLDMRIGTDDERRAALVVDPLGDFFKWDAEPVDVANPADIVAGAVMASDSLSADDVAGLYANCNGTPEPPPPGGFAKNCGELRPGAAGGEIGPMYVIWIGFEQPLTTFAGALFLVIDRDGDPANNVEPTRDLPLVYGQAGDAQIQLYPTRDLSDFKPRMFDFIRGGRPVRTNAIQYFGHQSTAWVVFDGFDPDVTFTPGAETFEGFADFAADVLGPEPMPGSPYPVNLPEPVSIGTF